MVSKILVGTALFVAMATSYALYQNTSDIDNLKVKISKKESGSLDTAYKLYTDCLIAQYMTLESKINEMTTETVNDFVIKSNNLCIEWTQVWINEDAGVTSLTQQEIVDFNLFRLDRLGELKAKLLDDLQEVDKQRKVQ